MMNPTRKSGRIQKRDIQKKDISTISTTSTIHKLLAGGQEAVEWVERVEQVAMPEKGGYGLMSTSTHPLTLKAPTSRSLLR